MFKSLTITESKVLSYVFPQGVGKMVCVSSSVPIPCLELILGLVDQINNSVAPDFTLHRTHIAIRHLMVKAINTKNMKMLFSLLGALEIIAKNIKPEQVAFVTSLEQVPQSASMGSSSISAGHQPGSVDPMLTYRTQQLQASTTHKVEPGITLKGYTRTFDSPKLVGLLATLVCAGGGINMGVSSKVELKALCLIRTLAKGGLSPEKAAQEGGKNPIYPAPRFLNMYTKMKIGGKHFPIRCDDYKGDVEFSREEPEEESPFTKTKSAFMLAAGPTGEGPSRDDVLLHSATPTVADLHSIIGLTIECMVKACRMGLAPEVAAFGMAAPSIAAPHPTVEVSQPIVQPPLSSCSMAEAPGSTVSGQERTDPVMAALLGYSESQPQVHSTQPGQLPPPAVVSSNPQITTDSGIALQLAQQQQFQASTIPSSASIYTPMTAEPRSAPSVEEPFDEQEQMASQESFLVANMLHTLYTSMLVASDALKVSSVRGWDRRANLRKAKAIKMSIDENRWPQEVLDRVPDAPTPLGPTLRGKDNRIVPYSASTQSTVEEPITDIVSATTSGSAGSQLSQLQQTVVMPQQRVSQTQPIESMQTPGMVGPQIVQQVHPLQQQQPQQQQIYQQTQQMSSVQVPSNQQQYLVAATGPSANGQQQTLQVGELNVFQTVTPEELSSSGQQQQMSATTVPAKPALIRHPPDPFESLLDCFGPSSTPGPAPPPPLFPAGSAAPANNTACRTQQSPLISTQIIE